MPALPPKAASLSAAKVEAPNLARLLSRLEPSLDDEGMRELVAALDLQEPAVALERDWSRASPAFVHAREESVSTLALLMRMPSRRWALAALEHPQAWSQPTAMRPGKDSPQLWKEFLAEALSRADLDLLRAAQAKPGAKEAMEDALAPWRSDGSPALQAFAMGSRDKTPADVAACANWVAATARKSSGVALKDPSHAGGKLLLELENQSERAAVEAMAKEAAKAGSEPLARAALALGAQPRPQWAAEAMMSRAPKAALAFIEAGWSAQSVEERGKAVEQIARSIESSAGQWGGQPRPWAFLKVCEALLRDGEPWGAEGSGAPWARLAAVSMIFFKHSSEGLDPKAWERLARKQAPAPEELLWLAKQGRWARVNERAQEGAAAGASWARAMHRALRAQAGQEEGPSGAKGGLWLARLAWALDQTQAQWEPRCAPIDAMEDGGWSKEEYRAGRARWEGEQLAGRAKASKSRGPKAL